MYTQDNIFDPEHGLWYMLYLGVKIPPNKIKPRDLNLVAFLLKNGIIQNHSKDEDLLLLRFTELGYSLYKEKFGVEFNPLAVHLRALHFIALKIFVLWPAQALMLFFVWNKIIGLSVESTNVPYGVFLIITYLFIVMFNLKASTKDYENGIDLKEKMMDATIVKVPEINAQLIFAAKSLLSYLFVFGFSYLIHYILLT